MLSLDQIQEMPDFKDRLLNKDNNLLWEIVQAAMPMIESFSNRVFDREEKKDVKGLLIESLYVSLPNFNTEGTYSLKPWVWGLLNNMIRRYISDISKNKPIKLNPEIPTKTDVAPTVDTSSKSEEDLEEEKQNEGLTTEENIEKLVIDEMYVDEIRDAVESKFGENGKTMFELIVDKGMGINEANREIEHYPPYERIPLSTFKNQWTKIREFVETFLTEVGFKKKDKDFSSTPEFSY